MKKVVLAAIMIATMFVVSCSSTGTQSTTTPTTDTTTVVTDTTLSK
jgi:PBP1b-binding outer membrane lipoprotein LpoB